MMKEERGTKKEERREKNEERKEKKGERREKREERIEKKEDLPSWHGQCFALYINSLAFYQRF